MGLYEGFKDVVSIAQKIDNLDLYRKILDLQAEAQKFGAELLEKDRQLHEKTLELQRLKEFLEIKKKMTRHGSAHYEIDSDGKPFGDPHCSHCFEAKHIAVHINQDPTMRQSSLCPSCKSRVAWQRPIEKGAA